MYEMKREITAVAESNSVDWAQLDGKTIMITGSTGLVGSYLVRLLLARNELSGAKTRIIIPVRNPEKAQASFSDYLPSEMLDIVEITDITDVADIEQPADYLIHAACPTASRLFVEKPVETINAIVEGTRATLEYARREGVESYVYLSSMEVYGEGYTGDVPDGARLAPADVGYVNPLQVRSSYPEGKRMAECLACAYTSEYGVSAKIARLAQTFGPGVPEDDNRVFMQFARCAIAGEDIVLKTSGASTRMYCYTADAATGILTVLIKGKNGEAYNVANENTYCSIREMAQMVADECTGGAIQVKVEIDPDAPYPPEHHLPLDNSPLKILGWVPQYSLTDMYRCLIDSLS